MATQQIMVKQKSGKQSKQVLFVETYRNIEYQRRSAQG